MPTELVDESERGDYVHRLHRNCCLDLSAVSDAFKPTRRVRTVPGGPHTDIFATGDEGDALSLAPPKVEPVSSEWDTEERHKHVLVTGR